MDFSKRRLNILTELLSPSIIMLKMRLLNNLVSIIYVKYITAKLALKTVRAYSSADRALVFGTGCRGFESL